MITEMKCRHWLAAVLIALIVASGVCAQNAVDTKVDPRLDKKVAIEVTHTKLEDVVKQLTEQSGVTIKAGTGERDWKVRERKVTIHAKDVPLGTLVNEISKLLGFYVSKSGKEGEWAYTFWQDLKARQLEAEMLNAAREQVAQRSVATRQSALDMAADALSLSPEEALKKKDTDPWLAYLGGTKAGRGYSAFLDYLAKSFPMERDLMLRGKKTTISLANLPPNLQQAVNDVKMGGFLAMGNMGTEGEEMVRKLTADKLTVMPMSGLGGDQEASAFGFGGMVMLTAGLPEELGGGGMNPEFGGGFPVGMFPMTGSGTLLGKLFGKMLLAADAGAKDVDMAKTAEEMGDPAKLLADAIARESPTEKEPPTDPELLREVELKDLPETSVMRGTSYLPESIGKEVVAVSKAIGKPVLLESFTGCVPISMYVKSGKQPLYKILIGAEKAGYDWTLGDGALRLRPDDWALQRACEIPESLFAKYREMLKRNGEFSLQDLASLVADLTDDQIDRTLMKEDEFMFLRMSLSTDFGFGGGGNRELLRLYGSLSGPQKASLESEAGLGFAQLSGPQWDRLSIIISDQLGGVYIMDGGIRLRKPAADISAKVGGYMYSFDFTVQAGGEDAPRTFSQSISVSGKAQIEQLKKTVDDARKQAGDRKNKDRGTEEPPKEPEDGRQ